jgi:hypothetical protein
MQSVEDEPLVGALNDEDLDQVLSSVQQTEALLYSLSQADQEGLVSVACG